MTFQEKWLEAVEKKNSVLCAGIDPAEYDMGRGKKGLPEGVDKTEWALKYVEAVAPYCAAVKPNLRYWLKPGEAEKGVVGDLEGMVKVLELAKSLGLVTIQDSKEADIGSTNDAGIFYAAQKADAVTFSPFAGNIKEAGEQARDKGIGIISMCLMSNPDYAREKHKLVPLNEEGDYHRPDIKQVDGRPHVYQYIQLAYDAQQFGIDAIVIGAPSAKNHIEEAEIAKVRVYVSDNMLVLLPGLGAQGGEADAIWKYFAKNRVIANVGRALMLGKGSNTAPEQQAETAKHYQEMLNKLRAA